MDGIGRLRREVPRRAVLYVGRHGRHPDRELFRGSASQMGRGNPLETAKRESRCLSTSPRTRSNAPPGAPSASETRSIAWTAAAAARASIPRIPSRNFRGNSKSVSPRKKRKNRIRSYSKNETSSHPPSAGAAIRQRNPLERGARIPSAPADHLHLVRDVD